MPTKKEIANLRELLHKACSESDLLSTAEMERQLQSARSPAWPVTGIAGSIETNEFGWLHITLNTLLPHCRFKTPAYLSDTITRLIEGHQAKGGWVPFFRKAILIIDEHCDLKNRQVFDQQSLELALLSTSDSEAACHIYVLDADDAGEFFSIRSGQYGYFL